MIELSSEVKKAQVELRYLLNRGYRRKVALKFVSNHHMLPKKDRNILFRKVFSKDEIKDHKNRKITINDLQGKKLGIDGYNVLITVENVLQDEYLVCDDGYIRDVDASFGSYEITQKTDKSLKAIKKLLKSYDPSKITFLYDSPVSKSGELAEKTEKIFNSPLVEAKAIKKVDLELRNFEVVATSDRGIIEHSKKVIDLPKSILKKRKTKKR